ncbi:MAG TPA: helix-turn-helix domain-containing protein [Hanamia sp.]|nr:helix-turn-helix domain-containing protein [Hanamia sp.]
MPTLKFNLSEAEIEKLNYNRYSFPDPMVQKRIHAVYLKATLGWSNLIIGQIVGLHYNVVGEWINAYKRNGFEALLSNKYGSNKSELEIHADNILESFQIRPPMTSAEAADRIKEMTGVSRSSQQVRVFMKRHELRFIKCGHIPAKADNDKSIYVAKTQIDLKTP